MENESERTITLAVHRELVLHERADAERLARRGRVSILALLIAVAGAGLIGSLLGGNAARDAAEAQAARAAALDQQRVAQINQLQSQLNQVREQLTEHSAHAAENPAENLLWTGIGSALGVPPPVTALVRQAAPGVLSAVQSGIAQNMARSQQAAQDARAAGQLRVIEILMQSCGTHDNANCVMTRMCKAHISDSAIWGEAESCNDSVDCWHGVLAECGN